ncbi:hypothetical protein NDU88_006476 [Pleurodeles waltl]|uniref:Uncharacterized protein n=1 Tax=Pleurodeles waltl TaxID=8319 RepID=A0AAV7RS06_PLEWA|nr:hypothetical protein NDU88_006476 [Pleurodeles waltl]
MSAEINPEVKGSKRITEESVFCAKKEVMKDVAEREKQERNGSAISMETRATETPTRASRIEPATTSGRTKNQSRRDVANADTDHLRKGILMRVWVYPFTPNPFQDNKGKDKCTYLCIRFSIFFWGPTTERRPTNDPLQMKEETIKGIIQPERNKTGKEA